MKIHIDIDSFFVSATRLLHPELEHKPVAIGGRSDTQIFDTKVDHQSINLANSGSFVPTFFKTYESRDDDLENFKDKDGKIRGILTTSSYEARAYGVKTAMRIEEALRLCPHLIIKSPNMSLYQKLSKELHLYLQKKIPLIEQASIDEFYGDLSGWIKEDEIESFIDTLRHDIKRDIKLPVSIGAANTRYIAKQATSYAKPFGCKLINKHNFTDLIHPMKVEDFAGIGRSMGKKLHEAKIYTLGEFLQRRGTIESWGPYAKELYARVSGESDAEIQTSRKRKSIGISRTIEPLFDRIEIQRRIHVLVRHLSFAIYKLGVSPTVFHLSLHYEMHQKSKANLSLAELFTEQKLHLISIQLFHAADRFKRLHIIRISIICSSFTRDSKKELSLISFYEDQIKHTLTNSIQELREKYGLKILQWGSEF
jgi:DNA polymerase-4